jgi:hypothetical protein
LNSVALGHQQPETMKEAIGFLPAAGGKSKITIQPG